MDPAIINRVSESGLLTLDMEKLLPATECTPFDLAPFLYMGLVLKEKEFRLSVDNHDWQQYGGLNVAVFCSADAIIPDWAQMLVVSRLMGIAAEVYPGTTDEMYKWLLLKAISELPVNEYTDKRVVVKGCGDRTIPSYAFAAVSARLIPHVKSLMYGEPCSTVPVYKRK